MSQPRVIKLNNGVELPRVGLGTYQTGGEDVKRAVRCALEIGIRHVDTASIYKNESDIAEALQLAGVDRSQLFLTSKISPYEQGFEKAEKAVKDMLDRLNTNYLDLILIHWPGVSGEPLSSSTHAESRLETWRVLERLYEAGLCKAIGVSNFEESHIAELLSKASIKPMVNQVEVHPRYQCSGVRKACADAGIVVVAYASLGRGQLIHHDVVQSIANSVKKSPAQVLLRWGLDKGCAVIPKSVTPSRIAEFSEDHLLSWQLDPSHIEQLDALEDGHKYCWDPANVA